MSVLAVRSEEEGGVGLADAKCLKPALSNDSKIMVAMVLPAKPLRKAMWWIPDELGAEVEAEDA